VRVTPRALLTGLTGQDGSLMAELLLAKGYAVTGLVRPGRGGDLGLASHLAGRVDVVAGELGDATTLRSAVEAVRPDEIYHFASPSFVPDSWVDPGATSRTVVEATAALLVAVREIVPRTRIFVASSGVIFGEAPSSPQNEDTPCRPTTPYAVAKLAAHQLVGVLREHDGLHASSGIAYNHESERRPAHFVTRRVTLGAAAVKLGKVTEVVLGDLRAVRDWSYAGDVMEGAWLMLQAPEPADYVLASGVGRTVEELTRVAFGCLGLEAQDWIHVDPELMRPPEAVPLVGDPTRAREQLGWRPRVGFEELIERMVHHDLRELGG
jgi:GDPmannose 4,6-dehydratase